MNKMHINLDDILEKLQENSSFEELKNQPLLELNENKFLTSENTYLNSMCRNFPFPFSINFNT